MPASPLVQAVIGKHIIIAAAHNNLNLIAFIFSVCKRLKKICGGDIILLSEFKGSPANEELNILAHIFMRLV